MRIRRKGSWTATLKCAALAMGVVPLLTGCDQVEGVAALVKRTASAAVQDVAGEFVRNAIDGIAGNLLPDSGGA